MTAVFPDPILAMLVMIAERRDYDGQPPLLIPLVLHIGPLFIYGDIVPERAFRERSKNLVQVAFQAMEETDFGLWPEDSIGDLARTDPQFIHLGRVTFSGPTGDQDPDPDTTAEMWRGRLSAIDGWTLMGSG